jgi:hypothetical protein
MVEPNGLETRERAYEINKFQDVIKDSLVKVEMCECRGEMR